VSVLAAGTVTHHSACTHVVQVLGVQHTAACVREHSRLPSLDAAKQLRLALLVLAGPLPRLYPQFDLAGWLVGWLVGLLQQAAVAALTGSAAAVCPALLAAIQSKVHMGVKQSM